MKKIVYLTIMILSIGVIGSAAEIKSFASITDLKGNDTIKKTSDSEGYIHFDARGNIFESNIDVNNQSIENDNRSIVER